MLYERWNLQGWNKIEKALDQAGKPAFDTS